MSGGRGWTIRRDSLELWQGLVLQDMGEVDFHVFWKYWKLTSSPNTSKLVLGPPGWSSDLFWDPLNQIKPIKFQKNGPNKQKTNGNLDNLPKSAFCCNMFFLFFLFLLFLGPHAFFFLGPMGPGTTVNRSNVFSAIAIAIATVTFIHHPHRRYCHRRRHQHRYRDHHLPQPIE